MNQMKKTMSIFKEIFDMPDEYKKNLCTNDPSKPCARCLLVVSTMQLKRFIYGETVLGTHVILWSNGNTYGLNIQQDTGK